VTEWTKKLVTMQYTETVYYKDGVEVDRDRNYDDHAYDWGRLVPMDDEEILWYDDGEEG